VDSVDPDSYTITDRIEVFGFHTETSFKTKFVRRDDGIETETTVNAGFGLVIKTQWTARAVPEGTEIVENCSVKVLDIGVCWTTSLTVFFMVVWFTAKMIRASHANFLDSLVAKIEKRAKNAMDSIPVDILRNILEHVAFDGVRLRCGMDSTCTFMFVYLY
jgi:hypothetical protein